MGRQLVAADERPFRILGFTDTHIDGNEACARWTMRLIHETISAEKPDMVIFAGDNVTGADNLKRAEAFADMLTALGVPWCPILGNHEGDNPGSISRAQMMDVFRRSNSCLIPDDVMIYDDGRMDYSVRITSSGGDPRCLLIFMDGGAYMSPDQIRNCCPGGFEGTAYACLSGAQIEWYRAQVRGRKCPSLVFCHIPLPEYKDAAAEGCIISGMNRESICCPPHNSGMFGAMLEEGSTRAYIAGHDHINDSHALYRGVRLIYNRMSGLSSYNVISKGLSDRLIQGCSVYSIDKSGEISYGDIVYADMFPEYMPEIMNVIRR